MFGLSSLRLGVYAAIALMIGASYWWTWHKAFTSATDAAAVKAAQVERDHRDAQEKAAADIAAARATSEAQRVEFNKELSQLLANDLCGRRSLPPALLKRMRDDYERYSAGQ